MAKPGDEPHPLIVELFRTLPSPGAKWTSDERLMFMRAVEATLNVVYPVTNPPGERRYPRP